MNVSELLKKRATGKELNRSEIKFIVEQYSNNNISETTMEQLIKIYAKLEMTATETTDFFDCAFDLAQKVNLATIPGFKIDKHSTGGIGDKGSLILLPILEAVGLKVFKLAGGRLGHTGGTLEKLATFPRIKLRFTPKTFIAKAKTTNLVLGGVTESLSHFEEKLYTLRNKLQLVEVVGMIVNSIMIKKIILNNNGLLLNVMVGSGALFSNIRKADQFTKIAIAIAKKYRRKIAVITARMNEPIGKNVGNKLEVIEAINALKGKWSTDLWNFINGLATEALLMSQKVKTSQEAELVIKQVVDSGKALECFKNWIENFGGNFDAVGQNTLPNTKYQIELPAWKDGFIKITNAKIIGQIVNTMNLIDGKVDYEAGIIFHKKTGDTIKNKQLIATIFTNQTNHKEYSDKLKAVIQIQDDQPQVHKSKIWKINRHY